MHGPMLSSLPPGDRRLLCAIERMVPVPHREEWLRAWHAELWHLRHRGRRSRWQDFGATIDMAIGLACDAFWLRTESWRCMLHGTALLCLGSLTVCSVLCVLFGVALLGSWQGLVACLREPFLSCLAAAPLVLFVSFATASRRHAEQSELRQVVIHIKRIFFFLGKALQVLNLAFLLSVAACAPLHLLLPRTADLFQLFAFVMLSLLGMRWALRDQEQRCKQCLQSLAEPARVGRPSHNLLEWNGTELSCKQGHGLLSVPEMETSWCQSSHWVALRTTWDEPMSI